MLALAANSTGPAAYDLFYKKKKKNNYSYNLNNNEFYNSESTESSIMAKYLTTQRPENVW